MDRLTLRRGNYTYLVDDEYSKCKRAVGKPRLLKPFCAYAKECSMVETRECGILKTADKLAAYEDTNLEPSEILALKQENERLKETLAETNHNYDLAVEDNEMLRASIPSCGCQYCLDGIDIIKIKFPTTHEYGGTWWTESVRTPKYCPMCGRKLKPEGKEE